MENQFKYSLSTIIKRLLKFARPIKSYLIISTLASIIGNLSHIGLMGFGSLYLSSLTSYLNTNPDKWLILTIISASLIAICRYLEGVYSHIGAYGVLASLRVHLFSIIDRISPAFLIDHKKGDLMSIAINDIETLEYFFAHTIGPMFTVILLPLVTLIVAYQIHPYYFMVLLPLFILISIVIPLIALKAGNNIGMNYRKSLGELKSLVLESVYGIRDIQIYNDGEKRLEKILNENEIVNKASHGLTLHQQILSSVPNFFIYIARILIIVVSAYLISINQNNPSGTILISFVAAASFSSTFSLTFVVTHLLETFAAAKRIFIIEDTIPTVNQKETTQTCGEIQNIKFNNVSFTYPNTDVEVLKNLNFEIKKGDKIGIFGPSGIGKSTLFRLLLRFYDPNSGTISFNHIDLKDLSFNEIYQRIGMLEQETYLFDDTIFNNIAIAKEGASLDEVKKAAEKAGIASLIDTLPEGYNTEMGQMASRLSGGEKQRIGIARIMLACPDIIVMDEPTSALDVFHEKELLHTLKTEYSDATWLIISHRMSTLTCCNRLYKLENGQLIQIN